MGYISVYPTAHNSTYVKATTELSNYYAYYATDPSKSLTGTWLRNNWLTTTESYRYQRFHIDLGAATVIKRIYYENGHNSGSSLDYGVKAVTFWGSNTASAFADLTYATDTNWTQLTLDISEFEKHAAADSADPKYTLVTNSTAYRYYALKIASNWYDAFSNYISLRRIELQIDENCYVRGIGRGIGQGIGRGII